MPFSFRIRFHENATPYSCRSNLHDARYIVKDFRFAHPLRKFFRFIDSDQGFSSTESDLIYIQKNAEDG